VLSECTCGRLRKCPREYKHTVDDVENKETDNKKRKLEVDEIDEIKSVKRIKSNSLVDDFDLNVVENRIYINCDEIQSDEKIERVLINEEFCKQFLETQPISHICNKLTFVSDVNNIVIFVHFTSIIVSRSQFDIAFYDSIVIDNINLDEFNTLCNLLYGCWHNVKISDITYKILSILLQLKYVKIDSLWNRIRYSNVVNLYHKSEIAKYSSVIASWLIDMNLNDIIKTKNVDLVYSISNLLSEDQMKLMITKIYEA
jgi:hypothetical protein